jgi:ketosteroid isomerase-like protein
MSQENVETIARLYDEFLAHPERVDDPRLFRFFDPAVEVRQQASFFTEGTFHGYDGLARLAQEMFEAFRDLHWLPIRLTESGDHVVATVEARGYGRQSGIEVNETATHVWTLREGRIVAWHAYLDRAQALEAAGLRE